MEPSEFVTLTTTVDSEEVARKLARQVVEQRLAACVQAVPIHSTYHWDSEIQAQEEILLLAKTTRLRSDELKGWLLAHHPYEVPEIIIAPIAAGSDDYLNWIAGETDSSLPLQPQNEKGAPADGSS